MAGLVPVCQGQEGASHGHLNAEPPAWHPPAGLPEPVEVKTVGILVLGGPPRVTADQLQRGKVGCVRTPGPRGPQSPH